MYRWVVPVIMLTIGKTGYAENEQSGPHWCPKFSGSNLLIHLCADFRPNARDFIDAMREAGAYVKIASTFRPNQRQYLMHWSWRIYKEKYLFHTISPCSEGNVISGEAWTWYPPVVPCYEDKTVEITWRWNDGTLNPCTITGCNKSHNHLYDFKSSINAAQDMVFGFSIVSAPARISRHSTGTAMDLVISWEGDLKIAKKNGDIDTISNLPRDGSNKALHAVGASYGVFKLVSGCSNHWSADGQ